MAQWLKYLLTTLERASQPATGSIPERNKELCASTYCMYWVSIFIWGYIISLIYYYRLPVMHTDGLKW
jgi:hypothetical protein